MANLLLWDMDHPTFWPGADWVRALVYCDSVRAISDMMISGQWRWGERAGHRLVDTVEYRSARKEAHERLVRLGLLSEA